MVLLTVSRKFFRRKNLPLRPVQDDQVGHEIAGHFTHLAVDQTHRFQTGQVRADRPAALLRSFGLHGVGWPTLAPVVCIVGRGDQHRLLARRSGFDYMDDNILV